MKILLIKPARQENMLPKTKSYLLLVQGSNKKTLKQLKKIITKCLDNAWTNPEIAQKKNETDNNSGDRMEYDSL